MGERIYVLRQDGEEIARHSTRRATEIAALVHGLTTLDRATMRSHLKPGVTITEEPGHER